MQVTANDLLAMLTPRVRIMPRPYHEPIYQSQDNIPVNDGGVLHEGQIFLCHPTFNGMRHTDSFCGWDYYSAP